MKITKKINVELLQKKFLTKIDVVQYTTGLQIILIARDFTIPAGTTARAFFKKPSGKFVYQDCTISGNEITIDVHNQALTEYGDVYYQVRLTNGPDIITTFKGKIEVEKSLADSSATPSETVVTAFDAAVQDAVAEIEEARDSAITYIGNGLDSTLSIEGKAADAGAAGKAITELKGDLSESITEISEPTRNINISKMGRYGNASDGKIYNRDAKFFGMEEFVSVDGNTIYTISQGGLALPTNATMTILQVNSDGSVTKRDGGLSVINSRTITTENTTVKIHIFITASSEFDIDNGWMQIEKGEKATDHISPVSAVDDIAREKAEKSFYVYSLIDASYDLNELNEIGSHRWNTGSVPSNSPVQKAARLVNIPSDANSNAGSIQIVITSDNIMYIRYRITTNWSSWSELTTKKYVDDKFAELFVKEGEMF